MQTQPVLTEPNVISTGSRSDFNNSGVSWGAVFAGAAVAAALSLILLILGVGLGLSSMSPWSFSATAVSAGTIIWLAFMQLMSSGVGGYLAGRLRVKWSNVHTDEVFFRDTAHGLLAWTLATLFTVVIMASAVRVLLGGVADVGGAAASAVGGAGVAATAMAHGEGQSSGSVNPVDYFSDMLMRTKPNTSATSTVPAAPDSPAPPSSSVPQNLDSSGPETSGQEMHAEVTKILLTDLPQGKLPPDDRAYLAQIVAEHTGASQADAQARVDSVYANAQKSINEAKEKVKEAANKARKVAAHTALWLFVSLLIGAFVASLMATFGGRLRDSDHLHIRN